MRHAHVRAAERLTAPTSPGFPTLGALRASLAACRREQLAAGLRTRHANEPVTECATLLASYLALLAAMVSGELVVAGVASMRTTTLRAAEGTCGLHVSCQTMPAGPSHRGAVDAHKACASEC